VRSECEITENGNFEDSEAEKYYGNDKQGETDEGE
jgi:hypothetical protein